MEQQYSVALSPVQIADFDASKPGAYNRSASCSARLAEPAHTAPVLDCSPPASSAPIHMIIMTDQLQYDP